MPVIGPPCRAQQGRMARMRRAGKAEISHH
jgi:hypothetical protein